MEPAQTEIGSQTATSIQDSKDKLHAIFTPDIGGPDLAPVKEDYRIRLQNFEGPLDLLLHLIRKEQIDIYDIPISKICESYLHYLELMKQFDVNIAGEFMVMAATLTFLKSQELIPKEETEEEEEDPRMPLVQQLLEYQRYKEAGEKIYESDWLFRDIFPRSATAIQRLVPKEALKDAPLAPIDTFQLLVCLKSSLDRTERPPLEIKFNTLNLGDKVNQFKVAMRETDRVEFSRFTVQPDQTKQRTEILITFLAILELAKLKFIQILQHENFGPIQIIQVKTLEELDVGLLDAY